MGLEARPGTGMLAVDLIALRQQRKEAKMQSIVVRVLTSF